MRRFLKDEVFKISKWVELYLSVLISIAVIGGSLWMIRDLISLLSTSPDSDGIYNFVGSAFNLVICVEFIKMLCKHTSAILVEVLMFAIARQMIVEHTNSLQNLICIIAISCLFAVRRFLFYPEDHVD